MKLKYNILAIVATIAFSGCSSSKKVSEAVDLNGEWNIVEVGGTAIDTTRPSSVPHWDSKQPRTACSAAPDATPSTA